MHERHGACDESSGASAEQDGLRVQQEEAGGVGMFGTDPAAQRRYEALMAKIAGLERRAVAAKRREAAVAIRWIKKAIRDYGIGGQELDFGS
jgi:hypothetical protein